MEGTISEVRGFAGNFAPNYWMFCNGSLLPIAQYTPLFALIGTTYGGDGQTTFALPDLRGRIPVHPGQGAGLPYIDLGEMGGRENVTLLSSNLPPHTHAVTGSITFPVSAAVGTTPSPQNAGYAVSTGDDFSDVSNANMGAVPGGNIKLMAGPTGGNQPIPNMMPYLALNYVICVEGIFPSRS